MLSSFPYRFTACIAMLFVGVGVASQAWAAEPAEHEVAAACATAAEAAVQGEPASAEALAWCTRALEQGALGRRDRAATFTNRGLLLNAGGQFDAALADFDEALVLLPGLAEAWLGRGNSALARNRLEVAVTDYIRAIELELPGVHVAHYNLGLARARQGRLDLAAQAFEEALRIEPEWPPAGAALAELAAATAP